MPTPPPRALVADPVSSTTAARDSLLDAACHTPVAQAEPLTLAQFFNLGSENYCQVSESAKWISSEMGLTPKFKYTGGRQGWIGDNPFIFLKTDKVQSLGWKTTMSIEEAIRGTVRWIAKNEWILEKR